ncbi:MAG: hypothetical protein EP301_13630, partial [Gammaproteobacteria bacterium]
MNALIHHTRCRRLAKARLLNAPSFRLPLKTAWVAVLSLLLLNQPAMAETPIDERQDAAADGHVEVINISGTVEVTGWENDEVTVTGTLGRGVERLDFVVDGDRTRIEVIYPENVRSEGSDLIIRVPAGSSLDVRTVSASIKAAGVTGQQWLNSVSGDVSSEIFGSDLEAETVSGSLDVSGT